jgi:hypothetical protein
MSHIAEVYAKEIGVKIGRPHITEHFYPLPCEKYITVHHSTKIESRNYDYWDVVLAIVKDKLKERGIQIVQVGAQEDPKIDGVDYSTCGNTYKQMNYVIKNSLLHVGIDSLPAHVASVYDIPSVILYANLFKEASRPLWHKKNSVTCIEVDFSKTLPSFSTKEDPKRTNEIKPETIAQSIFDQLGIEAKAPMKTVRIGSHFCKPLVEVVPDFFGSSEQLKDKTISVRADLHHDEQNIYLWSRLSFINLYLKQEISDQLILALKNRTHSIIFEIENLDNDFSKFFKKLSRNKLKVRVFTRNPDILSEARLRYFDFDVFLFSQPQHSLPDGNLHYLSKKIFISKAQIYKSRFSSKGLDNDSKFVLDECSLEELESFYIYERIE